MEMMTGDARKIQTHKIGHRHRQARAAIQEIAPQQVLIFA
jgi:hypothetical protein